MKIKYQKTLRGRSANQILAKAEISVMWVGTVEITISDIPDAVARQDIDGDLVLATEGGGVVGLLCGPRAKSRLDELNDAVTVERLRRRQSILPDH